MSTWRAKRTRYQLVHRLAAFYREHTALAPDAVQAAQRDARQLRAPVELRVIGHELCQVARPAPQRLGLEAGAHLVRQRARGAAIQVACMATCCGPARQRLQSNSCTVALVMAHCV